MTGGAGVDVFDFNDLSDSGTSGATMDIIYDFYPQTSSWDHDVIDLSDIYPYRLNFIGRDVYPGEPGIMRYDWVDGNTVIGIDIDGDMVDDFNILLVGEIRLSHFDFIL